jgi:hypothetical protein
MDMRLSSRLPTLLLLLAGSLPAAAAPQVATAELRAFRAEYEVRQNGDALGRGTVTLRDAGGGRWEYLSHTRGTEGLAGLAGAEIIERSTVRRHEGRLETLAYSFRQEIGWKERERSLAVDETAQRIVSRDREREHVFAYEHGVLDRHAVVLALARDLAAGRREGLRYTVADRDELGPQQYRVVGEDTITTGAGRLRTLKVERVRSGKPGRMTTSWHGIEQSYLPVRVLQREPDGDTFEMRLISLEH